MEHWPALACRGRFAGAPLLISRDLGGRKSVSGTIWYLVSVSFLPAVSCHRENHLEMQIQVSMGPVTTLSVASVFGPQPLPATFPGPCRSVCLHTFPRHSEPLRPQKPSLGRGVGWRENSVPGSPCKPGEGVQGPGAPRAGRGRSLAPRLRSSR